MTIEEYSEQVNLGLEKLSHEPFYKKMMNRFWNNPDTKKTLESVQEKLIEKYILKQQMTIQETYITFEQAKKLQKKGFPIKTQEYIECGDILDDGWVHDKDTCYLLPTLSLVQKWLREEKNILLLAYLDPRQCGYAYYIYKRDEFPTPASPLKYGWTSEYGCAFSSDNYEEALRKGIDKALEMI